MKNNKYRSLKLKIMLQTIGITSIIAFIGYCIYSVLIDGIFQEPFANLMVSLFQNLHMDEESAILVYRTIFWKNKTMILTCMFIIMYLISFYLGMSKFTDYLDEVGKGIDMILNDSSELIKLPEELQPLEVQMNTIKNNLRDQRYAAAQSEQRKNDLVVYLAHDLKTPLTSIVAYLSLLDEAPDMPLAQRAKYTGISLEKAKRLGELINEFFEITRYNLQNITLERQQISLNMLLEQLVDEFYPVFKEKNIVCRVHIEEDIELFVDAERMARVFDNLFRNAISYSYEETPIDVIAKTSDQTVRITVRNQGKEIAEHKLNHLFEKFYRLDEARSTNTGGAGLGLAIAKEIVELHGGMIQAVSNERYTEFIVTLPYMETNNEKE
ncbi:MAG: HAMP domain-containing histidine kinase [Anaerostipes sp.]|uniref:sensor histidine kinase n=1 Tax=Anaerostipes sp. 992a TaxID=1261637 RepID=UPI000AAA4D41|nr:HAMP domain-containing sensor histidine kinase [Anaerostipes sp. 992a]MCI5951043.1 HAMP domain-containing histidine kinase [Anaerostipes sp.]MDD5968531.1 HAMP domain-containing sensor histidine kinase [Anaerostipes sp.]